MASVLALGPLRAVISAFLMATIDVTFGVSRATPQLIARLKHCGLHELIGEDHFHPTNRHAAAACGQDGHSTSENPEG